MTNQTSRGKIYYSNNSTSAVAGGAAGAAGAVEVSAAVDSVVQASAVHVVSRTAEGVAQPGPHFPPQRVENMMLGVEPPPR